MPEVLGHVSLFVTAPHMFPINTLIIIVVVFFNKKMLKKCYNPFTVRLSQKLLIFFFEWFLSHFNTFQVSC